MADYCAAGRLLLSIQEILDFFRPNSVYRSVSAEMRLNQPHISIEFINVRPRSGPPGGQKSLNSLAQEFAVARAALRRNHSRTACRTVHPCSSASSRASLYIADLRNQILFPDGVATPRLSASGKTWLLRVFLSWRPAQAVDLKRSQARSYFALLSRSAITRS
jgi:hypothetical protein